MAKEEEVTIAQALKDALSDALGIQEKMNEAKEEALKKSRELKKLDLQQEAIEKSKLKSQKEILKNEEKIAELQKQKNEDAKIYREMLEGALGDEKEMADIKAAAAADAAKAQKAINELVEENQDLNKEIERHSISIEESSEKREKIQKSINKALKEGTKEFQEQQAMADGINKAFGKLSAALPGSLGKWFGFMQKAGKFIQKNQKKISDIMKPKMTKAAQNASNWWTNSKGVKKIGMSLDGLAKKGGMVGKAGKAMSGAFGKIGPMLGRLAPKIAAMSSTGIGLLVLAIVGAIAAVGMFLVALAKLANEIDKLSISIAKATGYANEFHGSILNMADASIMSGVGFKESADAITALAGGLSSFNPKSKKTNEYMATNVALLEKFGVSASQSVQAMDYMQRGMGLSGEQAADLAANVARMGHEVGITAKKAMEDFNRVAPTLARYGKDNIKVFKELQSVAKATGLSIDTLTNSMSKYDTFEGAASSAANLNAVLGTSISHLQMMNMNEAERIMHIKAQVNARVGDFDSLDKFTKMNIARSMGLKSVEEAQRVLNMTTKEYSDTLKGQKESAKIQEEMAEAAAELVPLMDQLKLAGMKILLAFKPVISAFTTFITATKKVVGPIATFLSYAVKGIAIVGSIAGVIMYGASAIGAITAAFAALFNPVTLAVGAIMGFAAAIGWVFSWLAKKINPVFINFPYWLAMGFNAMLSPLRIVAGLIDNLATKLLKFFLILTGNADQIHSLNEDAFNIEDLMKLDTDKIHSGLGKIKSAVAEIGQVDMSGILLAKPDGTVLFGGEDLIDSITLGRLQIDVNLSDQPAPQVNTVVKVGNETLKKLMSSVTHSIVGAA